MKIENLTPDQKKLLMDIIERDESGNSPQRGYLNILTGDDMIIAPRFGDNQISFKDIEVLCKAGLLILERKIPTEKYKITDLAHKVANRKTILRSDSLQTEL